MEMELEKIRASVPTAENWDLDQEQWLGGPRGTLALHADAGCLAEHTGPIDLHLSCPATAASEGRRGLALEQARHPGPPPAMANTLRFTLSSGGARRESNGSNHGRRLMVPYLGDVPLYSPIPFPLAVMRPTAVARRLGLGLPLKGLRRVSGMRQE
ncbi:hypothetical protein DPEC_G00328860 [Dallia pectoralis]|uniref:Uncharacterized protein n=1 Tax=Dallia pectoralis TaxID=75939 RepID=A0ACC2F8E1_DALPE|nr:hypothetical protein DPEC_G00328860 [Dallia pectoralis]